VFISWQDGVLTDLGALPGANSSYAFWTTSRWVPSCPLLVNESRYHTGRGGCSRGRVADFYCVRFANSSKIVPYVDDLQGGV